MVLCRREGFLDNPGPARSAGRHGGGKSKTADFRIGGLFSWPRAVYAGHDNADTSLTLDRRTVQGDTARMFCKSQLPT